MTIAGSSHSEQHATAPPSREPPPEPKEKDSGIEFASAMFGKIKEAIKPEPEVKREPPPPPEPQVVQQPEPEPIVEPQPEAAPVEPEKTSEDLLQEIEAELAAPDEAAPAAKPKKPTPGSGKKKTRKLKAKPKQ